ncbi:MAG: hypothetical protein PHI37_04570 [Candidatus Gracilibacteria bacterium]|nr:hypothetical protein [Candidatus Gracilibacteria bacterium]
MENNELTPEEIKQKKALIKKIVFITILLDILIIYFAVYFFVFKKETPIETQTVSIQNYTIAETLDVSCNIDSDCETPMDYMIRSNCPYTSKCLEKKCSVVCPETR